jgi:hypothetical protein
MMNGFWFSALIGIGLGVFYGLSAIFVTSWAMNKSHRSFMLLVLGGMMARLFVTILAITLILLLVPVDTMVFIISFFVLFVVGLVLEVVLLHRRQQLASSNDA